MKPPFLKSDTINCCRFYFQFLKEVLRDIGWFQVNLLRFQNYLELLTQKNDDLY